jgi:hypothetical protein
MSDSPRSDTVRFPLWTLVMKNGEVAFLNDSHGYFFPIFYTQTLAEQFIENNPIEGATAYEITLPGPLGDALAVTTTRGIRHVGFNPFRQGTELHVERMLICHVLDALPSDPN